MSRFPLTRTPAQAAMLARCLFGGSITASDVPREDGIRPRTSDTGANIPLEAPARQRLPHLWRQTIA